ncbi:MAG TPA: trypsin-like peptidase domain-containing protein [Actinophytocola sp.]|uniref:trypsin-like peptidase domain-containing protein n=1 Tax=Actinophytocola sp. TaxID=1872138 RepID=UPI002E057ED7|nr:trypsin-like peptidase domain-containing protein [Actinophytocola sp.]
MFDVFVTYRTVDERFGASAVYHGLARQFGPGRVFLDHQSIGPGEEYPESIRAALEEVHILVVLIGPEWLCEDTRTGVRLLDREGDWVRREIRRALERKILIIPVLLDGVELPASETLPQDIQGLVMRQAVEVKHRSFESDLTRLGDAIARRLLLKRQRTQGEMASGQSHYPLEDAWVATIHRSPDGLDRCGTGVLIADRMVLTCRHTLTDCDAGSSVPLWVEFPKWDGGLSRRRRAELSLPSDERHDLALLSLEEDAPEGVTAAPVRCPKASELVGKRWWAFGFPDGYQHGNDASGTVGAALADGCVRIDSRREPESRYRVLPGFSGAGLWSPDYQAVVGIVITANEAGDGEAVTFHQADLSFPDQNLRELARASAVDAGEEAMRAWGWALTGDRQARRHWRPRGRGVIRDSERGYRFCGRTRALTEIVGWLDRAGPDRRVLVITGSPGVGKSAVLGRIVTTADPTLRAELPADDAAVRATTGSVACAVHADGKTALEVATEIALAASAALPERVEDLVPAIQEALADRGGSRFNVVIDAVDQARTPAEARSIVREIASPLAEDCADVGGQVVIGVRRADADGDLLRTFTNPTVLIDLDQPEYFNIRDLTEYALVTLQLSGDERTDNPYADPHVAAPVAARIAALSDQNFLIAGLTALRHGLWDTTAVQPDRLSFAPSVEQALREYLRPIPPVAGLSAATVLTVLALAEAPGLTVEMWTIAIGALTRHHVPRCDLAEFAHASAANFLVESGDRGADRSYRLYHQALNDALLADSARHDRRKDDERALTRAFIDHGRKKGGWTEAPQYLLRSLAVHAAKAGILDELLTDAAYLLHADLRRLVPLGDHATTQAGHDRARLLRLTPHAINADARARTAMFSVTETLEDLGSTYTRGNSPGPYRARWAATRHQTERAVLEGQTGSVDAVCVLPASDGRSLLVSGCDDGSIRIWDTANSGLLQTLEGCAPIRALCSLPAPNGGRARLVSGGEPSGSIQIWDIETGSVLHTLRGHRDAVKTVCALPTPGGTLLASGSADHTVRIWDPETGIPLHTMRGHAKVVNTVCALPTPDGRALLASAGGDNLQITGTEKVRIWDPHQGNLLHTLESRARQINELCALPTPDGRALLASADSDGIVRIWDPDAGLMHSVMKGHNLDVTTVCALLTPGGQTLVASGGRDKTVRIWEPDAGIIPAWPVPRSILQSYVEGDRLWVTTLCVLPMPGGRDLIASGGGDDGAVLIKDRDTGTRVHAIQADRTCAYTICAVPTPDGHTLLASAGFSAPTIRIWDPRYGSTPLRTLTGHTELYTICTLPMPGSRTLLASAGRDHAVHIWDLDNGSQLRTLNGHTDEIHAMCALAAPSGRTLLASAGSDQTVRIWDPDTATLLHTLNGHTDAVRAMCALRTPGQRTLLASAGSDQTVRIWDPDTATLLHTLNGHTDGVYAVCSVSGPGRRRLLASGGRDRTVRIWDPANGRMLDAIQAHHPVHAMEYTANVLIAGLSAGLLAIELTGVIPAEASGLRV